MNFEIDFAMVERVKTTVVIPIARGAVDGPKLSGSVVDGRMVGRWVAGATEDRLEEEGIVTLRTHDDATIFMRMTAVTHGERAELMKASAGGRPDPAHYHARTVHRFEVAAEQYDWLNSTIAVGVVELTPAGPSFELFAL
jgi:hypothetical protein